MEQLKALRCSLIMTQIIKCCYNCHSETFANSLAHEGAYNDDTWVVLICMNWCFKGSNLSVLYLIVTLIASKDSASRNGPRNVVLKH
ncbi:hypothetical protein P8452_48810 [Trifolium repens]|nr:hypothetical protein P8452_48810 [Trifolium repens]